MIKIVDWNINGGHLIKDGSTKKNFDFFLNKIKKLNPDILLIQEGHISEELNQVEVLSKELGLKYFKFQKLGESHIEKENQLCLFVLSKFEILESEFYSLNDFNLIKFNEKTKREIRSDIHKKGFLRIKMKINDKIVNVISGHGHAFHIFNKNLEDYPKILEQMKNYILLQGKNKNLILGADLNYDNVKETFQEVFQNGIKLAFDEITTYKNIQLDYVMISENYFILNKKIDLCTEDHALIYLEIDEK